MFYDLKGQNIDHLLRDVLKDTIQVISLLKLLNEDEFNNNLILYQITVLKLNNSAKLFKKDIEQLPTSSRMVLLKPNTIL